LFKLIFFMLEDACKSCWYTAVMVMTFLCWFCSVNFLIC
jgi:hypothetical protein